MTQMFFFIQLRTQRFRLPVFILLGDLQLLFEHLFHVPLPPEENRMMEAEREAITQVIIAVLVAVGVVLRAPLSKASA